MARSIALILALAGAVASPVAAAAQTGDRQRIAAPPDLVRTALSERDAREQARRACADGETELRQRILAGTADAAREANAAAARGCFGLVITLNMVPAGIHFGVGVACRPNQRLFGYGRLQRLFFSHSDVLPANAEQGERDRRALETLRAFALAYNRAVLARPEFPYHDLCRVAADDYSPDWSEPPLPAGEWGYRGLEETDAPIDIQEAARRGTLASLRRMIEARPIDLHVPDALGLTPLAWAVIYNRPEHVHVLLEAGAQPYGELSSGGVAQEDAQDYWPIMIARVERYRWMTRLMQPVLEARGLPIPPIDARLDRARSLQVLLTQQPGWTRVGARLIISPEGRVIECDFQAPGGTEADCERLRRGLLYLPAENGDGTKERSSVFLYVPVNNR